MITYRTVRRRLVKRRQKIKDGGLTVGVDVDGVLANQIQGMLPKIRMRLGIQLCYEDVTEWRLPLGESNIAREIETAFDDSDYVIGMPVHSGARAFVDEIYSNNRIVMLTARPPQTRVWTLQWLQNHGFSFDELVNVKEEKKSFYRSDVLIDDYIGNITEYLKNTRGTAVLVDQPWNRRARDELHDWIAQLRLHIITDVSEATRIVAEVRRQKESKKTGNLPSRNLDAQGIRN
jgi:5'(3')-deoxyribonucleotidase